MKVGNVTGRDHLADDLAVLVRPLCTNLKMSRMMVLALFVDLRMTSVIAVTLRWPSFMRLICTTRWMAAQILTADRGRRHVGIPHHGQGLEADQGVVRGIG